MKREIRRCAAIAILVAMTSAGCERVGLSRVVGSGVAKSETRTVSEFSGVEVAGAFELQLTEGPLAPLELTADDNILPLIETIVVEQRLKIRTTQPIKPKVPVVIKATAPNIELIDSAGASVIAVDGVTGAALTLDATGASTVTARGSIDRLDVSLTGAGELNLLELAAKEVEVSITGAGDVEVKAVEKLSCSITGAGTVRYIGDPVVEKRVLGAGVVEKMKAAAP